MYQCVRYTAWIKAYASKLALGGFQCSGLSVSDFPELRFPRTRIFNLSSAKLFNNMTNLTRRYAIYHHLHNGKLESSFASVVSFKQLSYKRSDNLLGCFPFRILANAAFNSCTTPVFPWQNNRSLTLSSSSGRLAPVPFPFFLYKN